MYHFVLKYTKLFILEEHPFLNFLCEITYIYLPFSTAFPTRDIVAGFDSELYNSSYRSSSGLILVDSHAQYSIGISN